LAFPPSNVLSRGTPPLGYKFLIFLVVFRESDLFYYEMPLSSPSPLEESHAYSSDEVVHLSTQHREVRQDDLEFKPAWTAQ
jgi:hypothetical protein